jgi:hypothetical protein
MRTVMKRFVLVMAAGFVAGLSGQAKAESIATLYNTGVNASRTPLPDGTIGDPHYTLVLAPSGSTTDLRVRTSAGGYPIPPWVRDDSRSAWIGPNNDPKVDGPAGHYDYRTTFSMSGLNPSTAHISGRWATDNEGVDILINGVSTGNSNSISQTFQSFHPFSIGSGFRPGINTLDFVVNNDGLPTGLRVEMRGSAFVATVPEPSTMALGLIGATALLGNAWYRRRSPTGAF